MEERRWGGQGWGCSTDMVIIIIIIIIIIMLIKAGTRL